MSWTSVKLNTRKIGTQKIKQYFTIQQQKIEKWKPSIMIIVFKFTSLVPLKLIDLPSRINIRVD